MRKKNVFAIVKEMILLHWKTKILKVILVIKAPFETVEVVYVTIVNPAFCLFLYLTGVHFRSKSQHVGDVSEQKIKC